MPNTIASPIPTPPKIIFFDIDDTLYIKAENRILDSTIFALKQLHDKGIMVAIATGRGICVFPKAVHRLIDEAGIKIFVTINGQYNEYQGKMLAHYPLSAKQIQHTTDYLVRQRIAYGYMTRHEIIAFNETPCMTHALRSLHIPYRVAEEFDGTDDVYQILAFYENNQTASLELMDNLKTVRWHECGVDILDVQGSKARGIGAVMGALGLDMSEAWAFGDGLNDLEMLSAVGYGIAMGNAHPSLKTVADFICPSHTDDGIFRGLNELGVI